MLWFNSLANIKSFLFYLLLLGFLSTLDGNTVSCYVLLFLRLLFLWLLLLLFLFFTLFDRFRLFFLFRLFSQFLYTQKLLEGKSKFLAQHLRFLQIISQEGIFDLILQSLRIYLIRLPLNFINDKAFHSNNTVNQISENGRVAHSNKYIIGCCYFYIEKQLLEKTTLFSFYSYFGSI